MNKWIDIKHKYHGVGLISWVTAIALSLPASAQTDEEPKARGLEEIVVTAQRREESMQDVPISITALSGKELVSSGIQNHDQLDLVTPGLQYFRAVGSASPFIRGVGGLGTSVGNEGSVATYIDGVYVREMYGASQAFKNVDRVEVLKGPQGTLFGRNATGGLIQTVTKDPTHDSQMTFGVDVGNYEMVSGDFYGTAGLSENLAADLMVAVRSQGEGRADNLITGNDVGYNEYTQAQTKWLFTPSTDTSVTAMLRWIDAEHDNGNVRTCQVGKSCIFGTPGSPDFDTVFTDLDGYSKVEGYLTSLRFEQNFSGVDFVSLTSYQAYDSYNIADVEFSPIPLVMVELNQTTETFSQEFQLLSNNDSPFQWIAGLFYWDDLAEWDPGSLFGIGAGAAGILFTYSEVTTKSYAAYGQVSYDFTDATTLTLGARYTRDERELDGRSEIGPGGSIAVLPYHDAEEFKEPTWRIALNHHFSEEIMGYVSYNRGFKSGAYNTFIVSGNPDPVLDPEIMDNYAVGLKGSFLDNRMRLDGEFFFYTIDNLQLRRMTAAGVTQYFNAAKGEATGFDISATGLLTDNLNLTVNYAYLDAEYDEFPNCPIHISSPTANGGLGGNLVVPGDCSGNRMLRSPEYTVGAILAHSLPTDIGTFDTVLTYHYNDGFYIGNEEGFEQPAYSVVNASVTWFSPTERYEIGLYVDNLEDEGYSNGHDLGQFGNMVPVGMFNRAYGVRFRLNWN